jgi:hypothetical protein
MLERATRLKRMSPRMTTLRPFRAEVLLHGERVEQALRGMLMGAVAGVDHGDVEDAREVERRAGGGVAETIMSALSAWMFWAVSRRVSPLVVLELAASREMTSALRRLAAMSNAMRVRVLGSRKRLTIVLPRRAGTLLDAAGEDAFLKAVGGGVDLVDLGEAEFLEGEQVAAGPGHRKGGVHADDGFLWRDGSDVAARGARIEGRRPFPRRHLEGEPGVVGGTGRRRPPRSIEHGEFDPCGPAVIEEFVEGRLDGAAGEQHVVDQETTAPFTSPGMMRRRKLLGDGRRSMSSR